MKVIADLHLHSKYSRAVSKDMNIALMNEWGRKKGINLLATGDWTHPIWYRELLTNLKEVGEGFYKYKDAQENDPNFLLSVEISSIYAFKGRVRRIHYLIFAPNLEIAGKINSEFTKRGINLISDGRPITKYSARDIAELVLTIDGRSLIIPAHIWTPWFSMFGSMSGFDSIEECFGDVSNNIFAIETGLSSDPAMNWRVGNLGDRKIVSFSDAHSATKLGREATVFDLEKGNFQSLRNAIVGEGKSKILYTIEFYPEEGKYHYTGHRNCGVVYSPNDAKKKGLICPVCGKRLTVGVMSRVESLASLEVETKSLTDDHKVRWVEKIDASRPGYVMLVPLLEIISEVLGMGVGSKTVLNVYDNLISNLGSEFKVLLNSKPEDIKRLAGEKMAEAIEKVRLGDISISPGFDGVFGKVSIWKEGEKPLDTQSAIDQGSLF
jgi:uncharacterized protein (TIGR00375 family)